MQSFNEVTSYLVKPQNPIKFLSELLSNKENKSNK